MSDIDRAKAEEVALDEVRDARLGLRVDLEPVVARHLGDGALEEGALRIERRKTRIAPERRSERVLEEAQHAAFFLREDGLLDLIEQGARAGVLDDADGRSAEGVLFADDARGAFDELPRRPACALAVGGRRKLGAGLRIELRFETAQKAVEVFLRRGQQPSSVTAAL